MGIEDIYTRQQDHNDPYADILYGEWGKFYKNLIQGPDPKVSKEEADKMIVGARVSENIIARSLFIAKFPAYLHPPLRSSTIDVYKNTDLALNAGAANTNVLQITIHDSEFLVITHIANQCENLAAHQDVIWNLWENGQDFNIQVVWVDGAAQDYTYRNFQARLGLVDDPTALGRPLIVGPGGLFQIVARNPSVNNHLVNARVKGWIYRPGRLSVNRENPWQIMT